MSQSLNRRSARVVRVVLLVAASSCGAGAAPPKPVSTTGVVMLPPGAPISPGTLTISSARGDFPVGTDGRFSVTEPPGGGPTTVVVTGPTGKVVLLGHVDTSKPAFNDVSIQSTAEELLFLSTLSFMLPAAQWPRVYALLAAAPETGTVASVIAMRFVANPTAVGDQDVEIQASVAAATTALLASAPAPFTAAARTSVDRSGALQSHASALAAAPQAVSVQVKSADPYGLAVRPSLDDLGIYIENSKRIHRRYFVYRDGFVPSTGQSTDPATALTNWVPIAEGFLPAVEGVTGVVDALIDYWSGKVAWNPETTATIPLPIDPSNAKANSFKVYVVGAGSGGPVDALGNQTPPADLVALQPALVPTLTGAARDAALLELFRELLFPLLTKIVPPGTISVRDPGPFLALAGEVAKELVKAGLALDPDLQTGDYKGACTEAIKLVADFAPLRAAVFKLISDFLVRQTTGALATDFATTWASAFSDLVVYIKAADILLGITDVGSVLYQATQTSMYNGWDVVAAPPPVTISPTTARVAVGTTQMFQAAVGGGVTAAGSVVYDFTTTSGTLTGIGTAGDRVTTNGHELFSNAATVVYTAPTDAQGGAIDTVTVSIIFHPTSAPAGDPGSIWAPPRPPSRSWPAVAAAAAPPARS